MGDLYLVEGQRTVESADESGADPAREIAAALASLDAVPPSHAAWHSLTKGGGHLGYANPFDLIRIAEDYGASADQPHGRIWAFRSCLNALVTADEKDHGELQRRLDAADPLAAAVARKILVVRTKWRGLNPYLVELTAAEERVAHAERR